VVAPLTQPICSFLPSGAADLQCLFWAVLIGQGIMKRDRCFGLKEKKKEKSVPKQGICLCPVMFPVCAGGTSPGFWAKGLKQTRRNIT